MTSHQPLLSELCNICSKSTPKYRCPGCSAQTCSLPCYKLHQQRAVCDGKRIATKYVRKSQLETAAGIDHDFNFLAGLERSLDDAEKDLDGRGVGTRDGKRMRLKNYDSFRRRIEETQVIVHKAPVGLTRQRANKTRWNPRTRGILWTIEWIHDDGSKDLRELQDSRPLSEAYDEQFRNRRLLKRKRGGSDADHGTSQSVPLSSVTAEHDRSGNSDTAQSLQLLTEESFTVRIATPDGPSLDPNQSYGPTGSVPAEVGERLENGEMTSEIDSRGDTAGGPSERLIPETPHQQPAEPSPPATNKSHAIVETSLATADPHNATAVTDTPAKVHDSDQMSPSATGNTTTPTAPQQWSFYLLKPHTFGTQRVLIPLPEDSTLLTALRQRVVLEFPTLVVLARRPSDLPDDLVTEAAYERLLKHERERVDGELAAEGLAGVSFDDGVKRDEQGERVDERALAEVLGKDFGA